jgi:hypothetical protein
MARSKKSTSNSRSKRPPAEVQQRESLIPFHGELPLQQRRAQGKALRDKLPREVHGEWSRRANFPGAVEIVMQGNKDRLERYVPLRLARMAASPFAFYRGAAAVMAHDLAATPVTEITTVIDGDAHINNFGLYGTPQRDVIFDLNDFDESVLGPWEWDLKRLTASVNVAARVLCSPNEKHEGLYSSRMALRQSIQLLCLGLRNYPRSCSRAHCRCRADRRLLRQLVSLR